VLVGLELVALLTSEMVALGVTATRITITASRAAVGRKGRMLAVEG